MAQNKTPLQYFEEIKDDIMVIPGDAVVKINMPYIRKRCRKDSE